MKRLESLAKVATASGAAIRVSFLNATAIAVLTVVVATIAALSATPSANAFGDAVVDGRKIAKALAAGRPVIEEGVTIRHAIDLREATEVRNVFACVRCTFQQPIIGPHVVFRRGIDLTGSTLEAKLRLDGDRFEEAALFGGVEFRGPVDFAFSTFDDLAVFRDASFTARADFTSARFGAARFGDARFTKPVLFEEALFTGDTSFSSAEFASAAFHGAAFGGVSDFRQADFGATADFSGAVFRERAEFSGANLFADGNFSDARFGSDALFGGATLVGTARSVLSFDHAAIQGRLDLNGATLAGSVDLRNGSLASVSLDGIGYGDSSSLYVDRFVARDVALDLQDVPHLDGPASEQQKLLHRAETTAKSADNLGLANDLHYRLQELASQDDGRLRQFLDIGLYRYVAGYFVRPFRPLIWLVGLVFGATFLRALTFVRPPAGRDPGRLARAGRRFLAALTYTVSLREGQTPPLRRLELGAYAALVVCFTLGLANTNPTLRDMVDALF
jgi:uncharacterized protein YjbI with pentapeptide repeats